jgi:hypothetical protein
MLGSSGLCLPLKLSGNTAPSHRTPLSVRGLCCGYCAFQVEVLKYSRSLSPEWTRKIPSAGLSEARSLSCVRACVRVCVRARVCVRRCYAAWHNHHLEP